MTPRNRFAHRAKISEAQFRRLVRLFANDLDASQIAQACGLNRNTVNRYLMAMRRRIAAHGREPAPAASASAGPVPEAGQPHPDLIWGIALVDGRIQAAPVPVNGDRPRGGLGRGRVPPEILARLPPQAGFAALVDLGNRRQVRLSGPGQKRSRSVDDDPVACFWGYVRGRLTRFRGLRREHAALHLKECEFRFNHRGEDISKTLLVMLRAAPLFDA